MAGKQEAAAGAAGDPVAVRLVWAARLGVLAGFADLFAQFPVVSPYARDLGAGPGLIGVVVAAYSFASLLGNLGAVPLLARWGPRLPLMAGLLGAGVSLAFYAVAPSPGPLVGLRLVHGLAAGLIPPAAFALLGDAAPSGARARAMGSAGALIAVAAIAAPPLAGFGRDRLGPAAVFMAASVLLVLAAGLVAMLTASAPARAARTPAARSAGTLRRGPLLLACGAAFAMTVGLGALVTHLPPLLEARGEGARASGTAFAVYAAVALLAMAGPLARLADRQGRRLPLAVGLLLIGAALLVLAVANSQLGVYAALALFGLGFGAVFPAATALVADAGGAAGRGAAFGLFYAVYSLGVILGALASGAIGEWLGPTTPAPFGLGAACALAAGLGLLLLPWRETTAPPGQSA